MSRCPNFARLAKPPLYTHVSFHRQHPGSPNDFCQYKKGTDVLDPSHPAVRTPVKAFPIIQTKYFSLRACPFAVLNPNPDSTGSPSWPQIDTWKSRIERAAELRGEPDLGPSDEVKLSNLASYTEYAKWVAPPIVIRHSRGSIPMSLYFVTSKARTHKHAVKRKKMQSKFRDVVNLLVTRGAFVTELQPGVKELAFNDEEVRTRGNRWILPGWFYLCYPQSPLYLAPLHDTVPHVRAALERIWDIGIRLESDWAAAEMRKQTGLPPPVNSRTQNKSLPSHQQSHKFIERQKKRPPTSERPSFSHFGR